MKPLSKSLEENIEMLIDILVEKEEKDPSGYEGEKRDREQLRYDVEEALSNSTIVNKIGVYDIAFVQGYTGYEDGGSSIDFICRINDEHWRVTGYYDSWGGDDTYWSDAEYLGQIETKKRDIVYERTELVSRETGKVVSYEDKIKEE